MSTSRAWRRIRALLVDDVGLEGALLLLGTGLTALAVGLMASPAAGLAVVGVIALLLGIATAMAPLPPEPPR